jgi:hypothetical protein
MECVFAIVVTIVGVLIIAGLGNNIQNDTTGDRKSISDKSRSNSNGIWLPLRERRRIRRFFKR